MGQRRAAGLRKAGNVWHIQKEIPGYGVVRESTHTGDLEKANEYLAYRLEEIRKQTLYGVRPIRYFAEAAARHIDQDRTVNKADNAAWLKQAMPYIGELTLDNVHDTTLAPFVAWCQAEGNKNKTINHKLGVIRHVLNLCARSWRDEINGKTWLETPPLITMLHTKDARPPYPLSWKEQAFFFPFLPDHLHAVSLVLVHTGMRDAECCGLRWEWEQEDGTFALPADTTKGQQERLVVLNAVARRVIESQRGQSAQWVFPYRGKPIETVNNTGWQTARKRAAQTYQEHFGKACPSGFATLHVHDLRHTFGRRLRAAGVSNETRQDLLGHKNGNITTHYSAAEVAELGNAVRLIESGSSAPLLRRVA
jgi:integrase